VLCNSGVISGFAGKNGEFLVFRTLRNKIIIRIRYTPPPMNIPSEGGDNKLESTNYENSVLFLISCFQYILVAAVFSIGPPYRKSMWTNGAPPDHLILLFPALTEYYPRLADVFDVSALRV